MKNQLFNRKEKILMKQAVSKISAEKDGVFFVRAMTDASVMVRATIESSCFNGITAPAMICDFIIN